MAVPELSEAVVVSTVQASPVVVEAFEASPVVVIVASPVVVVTVMTDTDVVTPIMPVAMFATPGTLLMLRTNASPRLDLDGLLPVPASEATVATL